MVKCEGCGQGPGLLTVGIGDKRLRLCIGCNLKLSQAQAIDLNVGLVNESRLRARVERNLMLPQSPPNQLVPVQPVVIGDTVSNFHNINVSGGNFGVINTGQLSAVDLSVGYLRRSGEPELADAVRALVEAITKSATVSPEDQAELVEHLSVVSEEASKPRSERRGKAMLQLASTIASLVSGYSDLLSLWTKYAPVFTKAFGG